MHLEKKLEEWVKEQLITQEEKDNIILYENKTGKMSGKLNYAFMGIGALALVLGIISIISANWHLLSNFIKLVSAIIILIALAFGYVKANEKKKNLLAETILAVFFGGVLGYIGLIGQVYNLASYENRAFLLWTTICMPLLYLSKRPYMAFILIGVFVSSLIPEFEHISILKEFINAMAKDVHPAMIYLFFTGIVLFISMIIPVLKNQNVSRAVNFYTVMTVVCISWIMDMEESWLVRTYFGISGSGGHYFGNLLFWALFIGIICVMLYESFATNKTAIKHIILAYVVMTLMTLVISMTGGLTNHFITMILFTGWNIAVITGLAVLAVIFNKNGLFNTAFMLLGCRVIVVFFKLKRLLLGGIGLILLGIFVIAMVQLFAKYRQVIWDKIRYIYGKNA